ncbi:NAD(P)-dependent oxidoreductase [Roseobacter sp. YSTF-M11]|uniref:NAD(P)-dependent oxidoreductase n=1 Tax=Roseobacter insulae TaxID=2859783 RepID=A0A9X1K082_9RHOB|nr:NAD(P)-dependent oxidoreductase [Roseobacter insulae]MBW4706228.1 NAD(P)-dependent oxidoreductase [Roseobacter insulae]
MRRAGFAGLGRMGRRMAANCARAGHDVTVWNRSSGPAQAFVQAAGGRIADTPAVLSGQSDVVITMLADDAAARSVYFGEGGLIAAPGARLLVEMGTMSPALVTQIAQAAAAAGKRFVDAPVSGATNAAEQATLLIMAGADSDLAPQLAPLFDAMGRKTIWLGQVGAGATMKLAVNMLIHGMNQTVSEALCLAEKAGIATDRAFDVIENSAAAAPMLKFRRPIYLDEARHEVTFTVALARKDVGLALDLARRTGVPLPQTETTYQVLKAAEAQGFEARDMAAIFNYMRGNTE